MKRKLLLLISIFFTGILAAQTGVAINADGSDPDGSAILDVSSTDRGMLVPRMNTTQWSAIASPAEGLLVYVTDSSAFFYYNGSSWSKVANQYQLGNETNFAEFEHDGTLVFHGDATTYDDLQIPGLSIITQGSNDPVLTNITGSLYLYAFEPSADQEVFFTAQIPHGWEEGTDIFPHVHYTTQDGTSSGIVRWGLEYSWVNVNGNYAATNTVYVQDTLAAGRGDLYNSVIGFEGLTPDATQNHISSLLICRFFRDATNVNDTYPDDAFFIAFDIHYIVNTTGSREPWIK